MAQGQAQLVALVERVDRLQRDVDVLQVRLARGGSSAGHVAVAQAGGFSQGFIDTTESRFARLERQMQELTGRMEELSYRLEQLSRRLERVQGDGEQRTVPAPAGAGGRGPAAGAPPPPPGAGSDRDPRITTIPPPPTGLVRPPPGPRSDAGPVQLGPGDGRMVLVPGPAGRPADGASDAQPAGPRPGGSVAAAPAAPRPEEQYEQAFALVREVQQGRGDTARAEQAMRGFVQANPNHRLAGEARYWAGEMAFRRRDYRAASGYFAEGLDRSRNGPRAPDTMLGLARTLAAQNQRDQACLLLGSLNERYPRASQTVKTQATRERERLRCAS